MTVDTPAPEPVDRFFEWKSWAELCAQVLNASELLAQGRINPAMYVDIVADLQLQLSLKLQVTEETIAAILTACGRHVAPASAPDPAAWHHRWPTP